MISSNVLTGFQSKRSAISSAILVIEKGCRSAGIRRASTTPKRIIRCGAGETMSCGFTTVFFPK
jgi:hypothetical protein